MKTTDFNKQLNAGISSIKDIDEVKNIKKDELIPELKEFAERYGMQWIFAYASACEQFFEKMTRADYDRKTTFSSDFAIAEGCASKEGTSGVFDTFIRATKEWKTNKEFFAEIILATNIKSWEMYSRGHAGWSVLYGELYHLAKDLYLSWFDGNDEAIQYYFDYVD